MMRSWLVGAVSGIVIVASSPVQAEIINFDLDDYNAHVDENVSSSTLRDVLKDVGRELQGRESTSTSASGTIQGADVTIDSSEEFEDIPSYQDFTLTLNGKSIRAVTSAVNFENTDDGDSVTVYVNGEVVYDGLVENFTEDDAIRIYDLLGFVPARETVQRETSRTVTQVVVRAISQRIATFLSPRAFLRDDRSRTASLTGGNDVTAYAAPDGSVGLSGGDGERRIGVWANSSYSHLGNEGSSTVISYNGRLVNTVVGADYLTDLGDAQMMSGVTLGYENVDIARRNEVNLTNDGFSVIPYVGLSFLEGKLVVDAMGGYTWLDWTSTNAGNPNGEYDGYRWTAATNVTYNHLVDRFLISPSIGVSYAYEYGEPYSVGNSQYDATESYVGDLKLGGRVGYQVTDQVEAYTSQYYLYDLVPMFARNVRTGPNDRDELLSTLGVSYVHSDRIEGGIELSNSFFRKEVDNTSIIANLRWRM